MATSTWSPHPKSTTGWSGSRTSGAAFGPLQVITTQADNVASIYAADLDDDGDADVLAGYYGADAVVWFENSRLTGSP